MTTLFWPISSVMAAVRLNLPRQNHLRHNMAATRIQIQIEHPPPLTDCLNNSRTRGIYKLLEFTDLKL